MRNQDLVITAPFPSLPAKLRYIEQGDSLGAAGHQPPRQDDADAFAWFYGVVTGQVVPAGSSRIALLGTNNAWTGTNTFAQPTTFSQPVTLNGVPRIVTPSTPTIRVCEAPIVPAFADWTINYSANTLSWQNISTLGQLIIPCNMQMFQGQLLTGASVRIVGSSSDVALPATMPRFSMSYVPLGSAAVGNGVDLDTAGDGSASVGAYTAEHVISLTGLTHTIDAISNFYFLNFHGEGSTNSHAGLLYLGARFNVTRTSLLF